MMSTKQKSEIIRIINDIEVENMSASKFSRYSKNLKKKFDDISEGCDQHTKSALLQLRLFITVSLPDKLYEHGIGQFLDQEKRKEGLKELENERLKKVLNEVKESDELEDMAGKIELALKSKIKEFGNIK